MLEDYKGLASILPTPTQRGPADADLHLADRVFTDFKETSALPVGPYRAYVSAGDFLFCSGQLGLGASGMLLDGFTEQFRQAMSNLVSVLKEAGANLNDVVKTTVYLVDAEDFATMNEVYATYFPASPPARSCIIVKELPKGALVEIEAVAYIK